MNSSFALRGAVVSVLLAVVLAWVGLVGAPRAFASAAYHADDNYILVKSCTAHCAAAAAWAPTVQRLHAQFTREGWGNDTAIASRSQGSAASWGAWAASHLYYVDGTSQQAIRAELATLYHDLRGAAPLHVIWVAVVR